jgi:hypothetical protein
LNFIARNPVGLVDDPKLKDYKVQVLRGLEKVADSMKDESIDHMWAFIADHSLKGRCLSSIPEIPSSYLTSIHSQFLLQVSEISRILSRRAFLSSLFQSPLADLVDTTM